MSAEPMRTPIITDPAIVVRVDDALDGELLLPLVPAGRRLSTAEENDLARRIRDEQEAGERSLKDAVKHFRRCGEILLKAKADLGHGRFAHFLKQIARVHPRSAQRYMLLARSLGTLPAAEATRVSSLSLRDAVAELSRMSNRAAKLPAPALTRALAQGRKEPLKSALTKAVNSERYERFPTGSITRSKAPTSPAPAAPRPTPAYVTSLIDQIRRTVRVYAEGYPEMSAAEVLDALNRIYCEVQDGGLGGEGSDTAVAATLPWGGRP